MKSGIFAFAGIELPVNVVSICELQSQACVLSQPEKTQQEWFQLIVTDSMMQKRLKELC